jgi:hypothetical protein
VIANEKFHQIESAKTDPTGGVLGLHTLQHRDNVGIT